MIKIEQVVVKIQQFLNSSDQTDKPEIQDVAEQYAGLCSDLNKRIDQCVELLNRHDSVAAIYQAETNPPILQAAERLMFPKYEDWVEACAMYDHWMDPPQINSKGLELIKNAYNEHVALEPLLTEYRKKAREGTLEEKINLLRKIRNIDAQNPTWENDLINFENKRLNELQSEARRAIENNLETELQNIHHQLVGQEWLVTPQENVVARIEEELKKYRIASLKERAVNLLHEMTQAYSDQKLDALEKTLTRWDTLAADEDFTPESSDLEQVEIAREWYDKEAGARKKNFEFQTLLNKLINDIENKVELSELDNTYYRLKEFNLEIPESHTIRYQQARSEKEIDSSRKSKQKILIAILCFIFLCAVFALVIHLQIKKRTYLRWTDPINKAIAAKRFEQAKKLFKNLKEKQPEIYAKPEMVSKEKRVLDSIEAIKEKHAAFNKIMEKLQKIVDDEFKTSIPVENLIQEAEPLIQNETERVMVTEVKTALKEHRNQIQEDIDIKFKVKIQELNSAFMDIQDIDPEVSPSAYKKAIVDFEAKLQTVLMMPKVTPSLVEAERKPFDEKIKLVKKNYEEALERNRERARRLEKVYSDMIPLSSYKIALNQFINKFPIDRYVPKFEKVLSLMPVYQLAVGLKNFKTINLTMKKIDDKFPFTAKDPEKNIWAEDLKKFLTYRKNLLQNSAGIKTSLKSLAKLQLMKFLCLRFKDKKGKVISFYSNQEGESTFSRINKKKYYRIKLRVLQDAQDPVGKIYYFEEGNEGWQVRLKKKIILDGLTLLNKERKSTVVEHGSFCKEMSFELTKVKSEELEMFLLDKIAQLQKSNTINAYVRLLLIQRLFSSAQKIACGNIKFYEEQNKRLGALVKDYKDENWMNLPVTIEKQLVESIKDIPDHRPELIKAEMFMTVLNDALSRQITAVGIIKEFDNEKIIDLRFKGTYKELWVLNKLEKKKGEKDRFQFLIVGSVKNDEAVLNSDYNKNVYDAQPVFSPYDGRNSGDLVKTLKEKAKKKNTTILWPKCWPENSR